MKYVKRNIAILATCQAASLTVNITVIALAGLIGYSFAENKALATLPISAFVIGLALSTYPAAQLMGNFGRQRGFMTGAFIGVIGALVCSFAVYKSSFGVYCMGTMLLGVQNAFGQQYRFAAAQASPSEFKAKAISLVLAAGIIGGIIGPESTKLTKDFLAPNSFIGTYLMVAVICIFVILVLIPLRIDTPKREVKVGSGRPLREIISQPIFMVAALGAMIGYAVMNLVMTATPLAMMACDFSYGATMSVIEWHVIGMFAPSFFTGHLITRFGSPRIMFSGVIFLFMSALSAVLGETFYNFWGGLVLLGVGWNFLFIGGTTLLTECYSSEERAKVQGLNDFFVFGSVAIASLSSGGLLHLFGWKAVNIGALPFLLIAFVAIIWLLTRSTKKTLNDISPT